MEHTTGSTEPISVGIDVSRDRLDVAVLPAGEAFVVSRDAAGLDDLLARLRPLGAGSVALEATGRFGAVVAEPPRLRRRLGSLSQGQSVLLPAGMVARLGLGGWDVPIGSR
jgi:hypothetical protein